MTAGVLTVTRYPMVRSWQTTTEDGGWIEVAAPYGSVTATVRMTVSLTMWNHSSYRDAQYQLAEMALLADIGWDGPVHRVDYEEPS